jgi:putative transposase
MTGRAGRDSLRHGGDGVGKGDCDLCLVALDQSLAHPLAQWAQGVTGLHEAEKETLVAYRQYVEEGIPLGRRPELVGGGLIRSLEGWSQVKSRRNKDERMLSDERILGGGEFVKSCFSRIGEAEERIRHQLAIDRRLAEAKQWIEAGCEENGISVAELWFGSHRGPVAHLRKRIVWRLVTELGLPQAEAARMLGVTTAAIAKTLVPTAVDEV